MYGYRRPDLAVTRFYTSTGIRHAMGQMEEFDASLRAAIEAGGDRAVQFIRKAKDGSIVPCSPNKILVATTQSIRPHKRIIPVGFQSGYKTGKEWAKLHTAALATAADGETFPKPLILAGWAFSSDEEKRQRWLETQEWLEARGLSGLIESKVEGGWYRG